MKRRNLESDTNTGEHLVKMKAERKPTHLQVKECQRWPASHQKRGNGHGIDFLPQLSEAAKSTYILIFEELA